MQKNKVVNRIIIDTNILISFLISDKYKKLDAVLISEKNMLLFSEELLDELNRVSQYPKLKKYFSTNAVEKMIMHLEEYSELITVTSIVTNCLDPNDNFLLALAKDGKADFLITGDKILLDLEKYIGTKIISLTDFLKSQF